MTIRNWMCHAWLIFCTSGGIAIAEPCLVPAPQKYEAKAGSLPLPARLTVRADGEWAEQVGRYLWILKESVGNKDVALSPNENAPAIRIERDARVGRSAEEYTLEIDVGGVRIQAGEPPGVFNALATLAQIIEQQRSGSAGLPWCRIEDAPALAIRACHLDMTCQQFTAQYVCKLMRTWARYKVNAVLIEYSDMFPFRRHKGICRPDALSEADIFAIRRTAEECNQELIPFLQCLGHLEYVLHKRDYRQYGENHRQYMLCPSDDRGIPLVRELIDEIIEQHPGLRRLHVGGDEVDAGRGGNCPRCREYTKQHGFSSLYVRHYSQVAEYCQSRHISPLMWSDMILQHPAAITEMPKNVAWVVWDYHTQSDPTPSLPHGAAMGAFGQLSPEYRRYFGEGIGLADADRRGGLVAFGHAAGFKGLGFEVFTAPAARCSGDNFDLPRFDLHMKNIQVACRKASEFRLPGVILTSWSYRGSSHEVCLPEYACIASAWNPATPAGSALMRQFLEQRYGISDSQLAESIMKLSPVVPPSCLAQPELDDTRGAWVVSGDRQWKQIQDALKKDPSGQLGSWRLWQQQVRVLSRHLSEAAGQARRADELRQWQLALNHLSHRLEWLQAVAAQISIARNPSPDPADFSALDNDCKRLRANWADTYKDVLTPLSLAAELYTRFDAEREITRAVLAKAATRPATTAADRMP